MDERLLLAINGLRAPWLDRILGPVGEWGLYAYPIALLAYVAVRRDRAAGRIARDGVLAYLAALFVAETIVKPLIARPRPTAIPALLEQLEVLGSVPSARSLSMPSGTATACAAGALWIAMRLGPRAGIPAIALALVASLARLYAGIHWPSDVAAGLALGAVVAWAVDRMSRTLDPREHPQGASGSNPIRHT